MLERIQLCEEKDGFMDKLWPLALPIPWVHNAPNTNGYANCVLARSSIMAKHRRSQFQSFKVDPSLIQLLFCYFSSATLSAWIPFFTILLLRTRTEERTCSTLLNEKKGRHWISSLVQQYTHCTQTQSVLDH